MARHRPWPFPSRRHSALLLIALALPLAASSRGWSQTAPAGEAVMAWHVTIAPSWFDPSTAPPQITPFGMLYAIHDALVRPLPGQKMGPSLAESWTESPDGKVYEFKLRRGLKFHNGDPVTADDVKFSFDRYIYSKGAYAHGGYPDIDDLFQQQARERDAKRREALLFRIQQLTIDRVMFAPITDFRALMGVGPRVAEDTITWIHNSPFPSYEDVKLKSL